MKRKIESFWPDVFALNDLSKIIIGFLPVVQVQYWITTVADLGLQAQLASWFAAEDWDMSVIVALAQNNQTTLLQRPLQWPLWSEYTDDVRRLTELAHPSCFDLLLRNWKFKTLELFALFETCRNTISQDNFCCLVRHAEPKARSMFLSIIFQNPIVDSCRLRWMLPTMDDQLPTWFATFPQIAKLCRDDHQNAFCRATLDANIDAMRFFWNPEANLHWVFGDCVRLETHVCEQTIMSCPCTDATIPLQGYTFHFCAILNEFIIDSHESAFMSRHQFKDSFDDVIQNVLADMQYYEFSILCALFRECCHNNRTSLARYIWTFTSPVQHMHLATHFKYVIMTIELWEFVWTCDENLVRNLARKEQWTFHALRLNKKELWSFMRAHDLFDDFETIHGQYLQLFANSDVFFLQHARHPVFTTTSINVRSGYYYE